MTRRKRWTRRLGILMTPVIAATTTIATTDQAGAATTSTDDDNNTVDTADTERFELCTPDYGIGKFFSNTFMIEDVDGKPITNTENLTFELSSGSTTIDISEYVLYAEDALDFTQLSGINQLFDVPLDTYVSPISAPGLFGMVCGSATVTTDVDNNDSFTLELFPAGTILTAKRNGVPIATADISGRGQPWAINETELFAELIGPEFENSVNYDENCNLNFAPSSVNATDALTECPFFTDVYSALIEATGVRLHPSLAYLGTVIPSLLIYECIFDDPNDDILNCDTDAPYFLGWFFGIAASAANVESQARTPAAFQSLLSKHMTPQRLKALSNANNEVTVAVPAESFCLLSRYMALYPINEGTPDDLNTPEDEFVPPLFHFTAIGRGMADALSDPNVNTWPELDICLSEADTNFLGFITVVLIIELYLMQLLTIDIPMGNTSLISQSSTDARHIQMKSLKRIPFAWTDGTLASARVGRAYSDGISATGLPAPTYAVTSGALPRGLSLDATTGAITGTPKRYGSFTFTVTATNSVGSMSESFTISTGKTRPTVRATRDNLLVTFKGRVANDFKGKRVSLQAFKYGKWVTIARATLNKNGRYTARTFTKWKKRYRVVAGTSRSLVITK